MAEDVFMGYVTGKIRFTVDPKEAAKVDPKSYTFGANMGPQAAEGGAGGGENDVDAGAQRKKTRIFGEMFAQLPMGKGLMSLFKMLGPVFMGILAFIGSSSGLRELLGAFFDLIGLIADLIFIAIFPVLKPMLEAFVKIAKAFVSRSGGPGGIFAALLDPTLFMEIALVLVTAIFQISAQIIQLFADIINGAAATINSQGGGELGDLFGTLMGDAAGAFVDNITALFNLGGAGFALMTAIMNAWLKYMQGGEGAVFATTTTDAFMTAFQPHMESLKTAIINWFNAGTLFLTTFANFLIEVFLIVFVKDGGVWFRMIELAIDMGMAIAGAIKDATLNKAGEWIDNSNWDNFKSGSREVWEFYTD